MLQIIFFTSNGRVKILGIHAKTIKMSEGIDFERFARQTPMFSGAELEALINEAAISASMAAKDCVEMVDLEEARDKVRWLFRGDLPAPGTRKFRRDRFRHRSCGRL